MSIRLQNSNSTFNSNKKFANPQKLAVVTKVILDDSDSLELTLPSDLTDSTYNIEPEIGYVETSLRTNPDTRERYAPYNIGDGIPIVGEVVDLITIGSQTFYRRIPSIDINKGNAVEDAQLEGYPTEQDENSSGNYSNVSQTGTPASNSSGDRTSTFGEYFTPQQINPLLLYEGDKLIQSRFGQTIRFSGYNNENNVYAPTIIIRNRQSDKLTNDKKRFEPIEEDITEDGSTIAITSGEYLLDFKLGTEDTEFETTPIYTEIPEFKDEDQILIRSGRVILSSKTSEMIFFSKGDYGFVSDGKLTIDNGNDGAEMDFNGEVRMTTNSNNIYLLGDSGEIYLNTEETTEPLVRGETLKGLLEELIDAINQQVFLTPSGPTSPGPTNASTFENIKSRFDDFLSTLNYTE